MTDQLGLFGGGGQDDDTGNVDVEALRKALAAGATAGGPALPPPRPTTRRAAMRAQREARQRRRRRKRRQSVVAIVVLLLLVGGMVTGYLLWRDDEPVVADFSGDAGAQAIVWVKDGDGRTDIANTLVAQGVVASTEAFLTTTENDSDVQAVQPGYYRLQTALSAAAAADQLVDPANRVGQVELDPGGRLADVTTTSDGGGVSPGYVSKLAEAACVQLDGVDVPCTTAEEIWTVLETADLTQLRVPEWAVDGVLAAPDPARRLEGLIVPGPYDIPPNASAIEVVQRVMDGSATSWSNRNLLTSADTAGLTPYDLVITASIVERESNTADMAKVARVIENRRQIQMPLQMDSTVNYAADQAAIATTAEQRASPSPWNTYWTESNPTSAKGLPPTPISSPSSASLAATTKPETGPWLYFVTIDLTTGSSCFSTTIEEHEACIEIARANGVFDG